MISHRARASIGAIAVFALLLSAVSAAAADKKTITHGSRVNLDDHTVSGKFTLFDFYADWCGPCKSLEPHINRLAARYGDDLAVRKVDIINWQSEVAQQFRLRGIPHLKLYDRQGRLLDEGDAGSVLATLEAHLGGGGGLAIGDEQGSSVIPFFAVVLVVAVAAALLLHKGRRPEASLAPAAGSPMQTAAGDGVWFAMIQGSMEGPFNEEQLEDLLRRKCIDGRCKLRRRGDAGWRSLQDVLDLD